MVLFHIIANGISCMILTALLKSELDSAIWESVTTARHFTSNRTDRGLPMTHLIWLCSRQTTFCIRHKQCQGFNEKKVEELVQLRFLPWQV